MGLRSVQYLRRRRWILKEKQFEIKGGDYAEVFVCLKSVDSCEISKEEKMEIKGGEEANALACLKPVNSHDRSKEE